MSKPESELGQRVPFNPNGFSDMVGQDFYLAVTGTGSRERMGKKFEEFAARPSERIRTALRNFFRYRILFQTPPEPRDIGKIQGALCEVISREPHTLDNYHIGEASSITFEDGSVVGDGIDKVFEPYLFTLESAETSNGKKPILRGPIRPYSLHSDNVGEPLDQKVVVELEETPRYKTRGTIACF